VALCGVGFLVGAQTAGLVVGDFPEGVVSLEEAVDDAVEGGGFQAQGEGIFDAGGGLGEKGDAEGGTAEAIQKGDQVATEAPGQLFLGRWRGEQEAVDADLQIRLGVGTELFEGGVGEFPEEQGTATGGVGVDRIPEGKALQKLAGVLLGRCGEEEQLGGGEGGPEMPVFEGMEKLQGLRPLGSRRQSG
jgi:hypothetical protein